MQESFSVRTRKPTTPPFHNFVSVVTVGLGGHTDSTPKPTDSSHEEINMGNYGRRITR
jgi:hypothetical protein